MNRRTFLTSGVAGGLCALSGFEAHAAALKETFFLKPFARSRAVSGFAGTLFMYDHALPLPLLQAIKAELGWDMDAPSKTELNELPGGSYPKDEADKTTWIARLGTAERARLDDEPDTDAQERRRAAFFAWLAVRTLAPHSLRRIGLEESAADCEKQSNLEDVWSALHNARVAIADTVYNDSKLWSRSAAMAADTCLLAVKTAHCAIDDDINVVIQAGGFCAYTLLDCSFGGDAEIIPVDTVLGRHWAISSSSTSKFIEDVPTLETSWTWDMAAGAINAAIGLDTAELPCIA